MERRTFLSLLVGSVGFFFARSVGFAKGLASKIPLRRLEVDLDENADFVSVKADQRIRLPRSPRPDQAIKFSYSDIDWGTYPVVHSDDHLIHGDDHLIIDRASTFTLVFDDEKNDWFMIVQETG
jgi:hypothetical protein